MPLPSHVIANLQNLRLILLDVDGVLTDGHVGLLPTGEEIKFFSIYDGLAVRLAQRVGWEVGFISGRTSDEVAARAAELGVELVIQGSKDKVKDFTKILAQKKLESSQVAYMGDDLPDIPLLKQVGLAAAPSNAIAPVKYFVHYVSRAKGGDGAVRELVDVLLKNTGKWDEILEELGQQGAPAAG